MALASPWLQQRRLSHVAPFIEAPLLDVGCGDCAASTFAPRAYVGIDRDPSPLCGTPHGAQRIQANADGLPFEDGTFKTVLAMAVLEHVDDPAACLTEALRVLRPDGRLVLTTPTPFGDRIHHTLARVNVTSKHAAEEHQSVMGPRALRRVIEEAGFVIERFQLFLLGGNQLCVAAPRYASPETAAICRRPREVA
jgi:SAM-dependent methyltransferase